MMLSLVITLKLGLCKIVSWKCLCECAEFGQGCGWSVGGDGWCGGVLIVQREVCCGGGLV